MPVPRSSHFSPWRLVCSHHIHDGGLRAQYKAYGEFRLSQQSQHIRELASHNFICEMPPCSCKAKGLDISELYSEGYNQSDIPQWGDIGRNSTTRRHRKRPTFATRTYCPNPNLKQQSGTHSYIPPDSTPTDNANRPQSRAPPPQPHSQRPTSRQAAQAWSNYKERCHAMCNLPQQADPGTRYLTFSSIPWPVFGAVNIISDLHAEAIKEFLCPPNCDRREQRARVKSALLVFHPDKSAARWISFLRHDDIPTVHSALNIVTQHLTSILQSL
ncbi:hypothetical protein RhiXN_00585 [Rhizoctonia solani]|uniref:Uncharacterized protein n=1 Tax=Rhizoctonia solani TaxID=456999 RepID=A0A8H8SV67_9AGAM|nr:uncharacterized protein RhiXN_00585 [Rhizoctonia solani]QRW19179.1 hypothetical protein RhiXN_00585 [Rhizoctonia solani]